MSHRFTRCQLCKLWKSMGAQSGKLELRLTALPSLLLPLPASIPLLQRRRQRGRAADGTRKRKGERGLALVRTGTPGLCLRRCLSIPGAQHRAWRPQVAVPLTVSARALYTAASHVLQIGYFTLPPPCHCQPLRGRSANPNRGVPDTAILEAYRSIHSLPFPLNSLSRSEFYRCARLPHQALPHQFPCLLSFFSH